METELSPKLYKDVILKKKIKFLRIPRSQNFSEDVSDSIQETGPSFSHQNDTKFSSEDESDFYTEADLEETITRKYQKTREQKLDLFAKTINP